MKVISLRAPNRQYVCAEAGGDHGLLANRDDRGVWETFFLDEETSGDPIVSIRVHNLKYISANNGGGGDLLANGQKIGPWEKFKMDSMGGNAKRLMASDGHHFVRVVADGGVLDANGSDGHSLDVEILPRIALKSHHGRYLCAENGGGGELLANREKIGPWEIFEAKMDNAFDKMGFRTWNGKYICADADQRLNATRDWRGPWETFEIIYPDGKGKEIIVLKASNGKYVAAEKDGRLIANREKYGPWEEFELIKIT